ncbi:MAG: GNAT family N-acetyltransferase [Candidatus Thorarchaeota archaeon]
MQIKKIKDKSTLYNFFIHDKSLYGYHIGDLDSFFFDSCKYFCLIENNILKEVILLFEGLSTPTLLVFDKNGFSKNLLSNIINDLPNKFYCHYFPIHENDFKTKFKIKHLGSHYKMFLANKSLISQIINNNIVNLTDTHKELLSSFYNKHYPTGYFENHMLLTKKYFGYFQNGDLISVAGVHVFAPTYRTAILGNIATDSSQRNKGFAKKTITFLINNLLNNVEFIGLNVKQDNYSAIKLYESIGFIISHSYEEALIERKK